jgi:tetratricopeptide (TPR) repeat protein
MLMRKLSVAAALMLFATSVLAEESAWTLLDRGLKEMRKGRLERAERIFEAAVKKDGRCEDAYYYLGAISEKKKLHRKAEGLFLKVTDKSPTHSLAAERLGQMALRKGDKEKALAHFLVYVKARPTGQGHMQVATVQIDLKKYKEAELSLAEAKKTLRGNLDLVEMYGRLYLETERFPEALEAYRTIVKTIPIDNRARYLCGNCLERLDRSSDAEREYRQVLTKDPYHTLTLRALVRLYENDRSKRAEVAEYKKRLKALAKNPPKVRRVSGKKKS